MMSWRLRSIDIQEICEGFILRDWAKDITSNYNKLIWDQKLEYFFNNDVTASCEIIIETVKFDRSYYYFVEKIKGGIGDEFGMENNDRLN